MLIIENLSKRFGKFYALKGISMEIKAGEIYAFVGPNGAGKTTTMKIVAGLIEQTEGDVFVDGINIRKSPNDYKHNIGYMPDFFGVYDDLKVTEYLNFYCGIQKISSKKRPQIIADLLTLVKLDDKSDFYVDNLSRGMKQRLCLARCLIHDPKLLILDEPASGLDPKARMDMKEILKNLKNIGKTILISSHILPELSEMCTSVGIIENGKMIVSGTVEEILKMISGHKKIRVRTLSSQIELISFIKDKYPIEISETSDGQLEFSLDGEDNDRALLLSEMINKGHKIVSFTELEGNLETIFIHISGGTQNDNKSSN
jgi:ABC-2 type transport system ATP-binding protein